MIRAILYLIRSRWQAWRRHRAREQHIRRHGFLCLCPSCRQDLDAPVWTLTLTECVLCANCPHCGRVSHWFFGAPVPILLDPAPQGEP